MLFLLQSYIVHNHFKIQTENSAAIAPESPTAAAAVGESAPLHGLLTVVGRFELPSALPPVGGEQASAAVAAAGPPAGSQRGDDSTSPQPQRLVVLFDKLVLRPVFPERQLAAWLRTLAAANPSMRPDDGVMEIPLASPLPPKGHLDYIVMTHE